MLWHSNPEAAERLAEEEQRFVNHRYSLYQQLSKLDWSDGEEVAQVKAGSKLNRAGEVPTPTNREG